MGSQEMNEYVLSMDKIEAHEILVLIQATTYPHQEDKEKTKTINRLKKICTTEDDNDGLDPRDFAKALGMI